MKPGQPPSAPPIGILATGMVTSVGLTTTAACAAIRAGIRNPAPLDGIDSLGAPIVGHRVPWAQAQSGRDRLIQLGARALRECLADAADLPPLALLVCVAEPQRAGRPDGLDPSIGDAIAAGAGRRLDSEHSTVIAGGRAAGLVALEHARKLIAAGAVERVAIVGVDSLLEPATLMAGLDADRILIDGNSNGYMPGEAAVAVLVGTDTAADRLVCDGIGFAVEPAPLDCDEPSRADGLTAAIQAALNESRSTLADLAFRITDNAGEHYYFREAALALSRTWRGERPSFGFWHPADCIGETGAASALAAIAVALQACRKGYAPGPRLLVHAGTDAGHRAAAVFSYQGVS